MKLGIFLKFFLFLSFPLLLIACGGGGGGNEGSSSPRPLFVSVTYPYPANVASLYHPTTLSPTLTGFQGHAAMCSLNSGTLPTGMALNSNCTITGIPTQLGNFPFGIQVSAAGASNTVTTSASLTVQGPNPFYSRYSLTIGNAVNDLPNLGWTPPAGLVTSWSYQIQSGALPPGLTLNGVTGSISGVPTTLGTYSAIIQRTLTTVYGTYTPGDTSYNVIVN